MSFPNIKITAQGKQLLTRALTGEPMEFTKFAVGSGTCGNSEDWENLTGLIMHQKDVPFFEYKRDGELVAFSGSFDTSTVPTAFWWRELAIYGTLTDDDSVGEVMVFYGNSGDKAEFIHEAGSEVAVTHSWTTKIALSSDANVAAIVNSTTYATTQQLMDHMENASNPHKVTKDQIGLGKVKNLAIEDEAPVYEEAKSLTELTSGEKILVAFGKIKKAIAGLISHLADSDNPHKLNTEKIGAAPKNHRTAGTDYGMGNNEYFGHVKLTDDPHSKTTASDGIAITPAALEKVLADFNPGDGEYVPDTEEINNLIEQALEAAKASGEFDGEDGKDGKDGEDGEDGKDGHTPVKGVDYYTEEDQEEMVEAVLDKFPGLQSVSVTETDTTVTLAYTLDDGTPRTDILSFDANGYPTGINANGVNIPVTWRTS